MSDAPRRHPDRSPIHLDTFWRPAGMTQFSLCHLDEDLSDDKGGPHGVEVVED